MTLLFRRFASSSTTVRTTTTARYSSSFLSSTVSIHHNHLGEIGEGATARRSTSTTLSTYSPSFSWFPRRSFATDQDGGSGIGSTSGPTTSSPPSILQTKASDLATTSCRGIGQVIFLNDPKSGAYILGGLALGDPYLASLAAIGTVSAHMTAQTIHLDRTALDNGLWSYNGCLVGCAMAVFGPQSIAMATTSTLIGACVSPLVAASLKPMCGTMPQWTFAFNIVTLTSLLRTRPLLPPESTEIAVMENETEFLSSLADSAVAIPPAVTPAPTTTGMIDIMASPLTGISQIFVVESALAGAVIAAGGVATYSPGLAAHAVTGSAVGALTGACLGAPGSEIASGLWGFNSALTSMAVGVFFVHSTPTMVFSAGGAAATAAVFGAMKEIFGVYGSPCLTLPFCFTMSACYLLHKQIPGLILASSPHSPEKNTSRTKGGLSGL